MGLLGPMGLVGPVGLLGPVGLVGLMGPSFIPHCLHRPSSIAHCPLPILHLFKYDILPESAQFTCSSYYHNINLKNDLLVKQMNRYVFSNNENALH